MSSTRDLFTKLAASCTLLVASAAPAYAHDTDDVHHWFDHQRARTDGGEIGFFQAEQPQTPMAARPAPRPQPRVALSAPRNCLIEELKRGEGYVPEPCDAAAERRHWVVDEDKDDARRLGQAPSR